MRTFQQSGEKDKLIYRIQLVIRPTEAGNATPPCAKCQLHFLYLSSQNKSKIFIFLPLYQKQEYQPTKGSFTSSNKPLAGSGAKNGRNGK